MVEAAVVSGVAAVSAFGRGTRPLLSATLAATPVFRRVERFDVSRRRVSVAATLPGQPDLLEELVGVVDQACGEAGLDERARETCPLLLAVHGDPTLARADVDDRPAHSAQSLADRVVARTGLSDKLGLDGRLASPPTRVYTSACVAASTAVADAATLVALGRADRVVVAAGYLVESDQFALFDAGRALATDGSVRPFSAGRTGLLLGDGVAAVVISSAAAAARRDAPVLARVAGWSRTGDAYHVCQPRPDGAGLARAIGTALRRAGVRADEVGYVNAHGSGTPFSDAAEAAALHLALGSHADRVPVSSTKSVHGQALEASGLLEFIVTVLAMREGCLPVNAGYLEPDPECRLDIIAGEPREASPRYALSLNAAFGGANTALLVGAA